MAITATQRPDAKSLPPGISSSAVLRYCLKVAGHLENDMVLGTGAFQAGIRATMFARSDKGVGYLAGEGDDPVIVRAAEIDAPTAEKIAARARAARLAAGLLTGHAAGVAPRPARRRPTSASSTTCCRSGPPTPARVWCDDLADLLTARPPGYYDGWSGEQVTAAVKPHGVTTRQVKRRRDGDHATNADWTARRPNRPQPRDHQHQHRDGRLRRRRRAGVAAPFRPAATGSTPATTPNRP